MIVKKAVEAGPKVAVVVDLSDFETLGIVEHVAASLDQGTSTAVGNQVKDG